MLPICAFVVKSSPPTRALDRTWWISIQGWPLRDRGSVNSHLPKWLEPYLEAGLSKAAHCSVTVQFHFNIVKTKPKNLFSVKKYTIYPPVEAKGENPSAKRVGEYFMQLEKQGIRIFKGLQIEIRSIRMTGPEIKHFTHQTGTRQGKSNSYSLRAHPEGTCCNLPSPVMSNRVLETSQLEGYKICRRGKKALQSPQTILFEVGFFKFGLATLSNKRNKSNVSAMCLRTC